MRILVVGATGTIGSAVVTLLTGRHEVVSVGHHRGDFHVDLAHTHSIKALYQSVGPCNAVICTAGIAKFGGLEEMGDADFYIGLTNKLMGQVNLVRIGLPHIKDYGSFTLTSGVLSHEPMKGSASISMVNAGVEGFVRAAALELPRGLRINAVSPPWVIDTLKALGMDPEMGIPAEQAARAYVRSIEGTDTGRIFDPRNRADH